MEVVTDFIFLGSKITGDGDFSQEIKRSLLLGRKAMANLDSILKSRDITLPTKVRIVKAMVFPVAMYGCESWTIRKAECKRIEVFELWCWRRLLQVPWTARRSNQSVLEINPDCSLEGHILKMKLKYFGHLMRRKHSLEKSLMLGTIDGKRRRGRQRMRWLDGVTEAVGMSLGPGGTDSSDEDDEAWGMRSTDTDVAAEEEFISRQLTPGVQAGNQQGLEAPGGDEKDMYPRTDMYQRVQNPRGEGSLASPKKFKNQDFVRLRDHCLNHGLLFEDYTFPADHSSIGPGLLSDAQLLQIQWFRPTSEHILIWKTAGVVDKQLLVKAIDEKAKSMGTRKMTEGKAINILGQRLRSVMDWMRDNKGKHKPDKDLLNSPHLVVDGMSRFDIVQGDVGDCWVLAALGSLTLQPQFLENVIPKDQGFTQKYAGIFHFQGWVTCRLHRVFVVLPPQLLRHGTLQETETLGEHIPHLPTGDQAEGNIETERFWYFGDWVDVVIDDRLPFLNGKYLSVHPRSKNEFWPPLLEKAYAKLRGSYRNLHWGYISEALVDFTGGVEESFDLKRPCSFLHEMLKHAAESGCLMGCTTPNARSRNNIELKNGIVLGHVYTIVWATEVLEPEMKNYNIVVSLSQKPMNNIRGIGFLIDKVGPQGRTRCEKTGLMRMRDVTNYFHLKPGRYIITPIASQEGQEFEFLLRIFLKSPNNLRKPSTERSPVQTMNMPKWNQGNFYENIFLRYANQSSYLDASQLQRILNEVVLKADLTSSLTAFLKIGYPWGQNVGFPSMGRAVCSYHFAGVSTHSISTAEQRSRIPVPDVLRSTVARGEQVRKDDLPCEPSSVRPTPCSLTVRGLIPRCPLAQHKCSSNSSGARGAWKGIGWPLEQWLSICDEDIFVSPSGKGLPMAYNSINPSGKESAVK
ncbi:Calpain-13 [Varanus komodoensis]|nr:Calpain-13 [Varanus komodoensis]